MAGLAAQTDIPDLTDIIKSDTAVEKDTARAEGQGMVKLLTIDGAIGPITVQLIEKGIRKSEQENAQALIILLNTPGGLTESTWKIIQAIMNANVPVVVYVYPQGARAASAGAYITYSAHIAAMAPATSMGSASVVSMGSEMDSTMYKKVTNDAVANMVAVAHKRGRNEAWIERAIREAVSISSHEAVDSNVVDLVAEDIDDLLNKIDGREVEVSMGFHVLNTAGALKTEVKKTFSEKFLEIITNPNIAFLLFSLGGLGLVLELYNPGAILPGVVGGICIILAFFSFQTLPINYAGLLLILFSIVLFLLEIKVPSYGILTIGGIVSLVLGGVMLIDSPAPYLRVSWYVIAAVVVVFVGFFGFAVRYVVKAHHKQVTTGAEGLVGLIGKVKQKIDPTGLVLVAGELWRARADEPIEKDERVKVVSSDGMEIKVEKHSE
ncbi:MAG TPA: nodulation protein NfeD [candidate division Zixibacteria bacterium]|nr:nodulation protein NfeD [candidate division Zixibacteria bacterium]HER00619.1 nodulation protein NfeD [candidate division Zixibacteria bacterium]